MLHLPAPPLSLIDAHTSTHKKLSNLKCFAQAWETGSLFFVPFGSASLLIQFILYFRLNHTIMHLLFRMDVRRFTPHAFSLLLHTDLQLLSYVRVLYCTLYKYIIIQVYTLKHKSFICKIFEKTISDLFIYCSPKKSILTACKFKKKFTTWLVVCSYQQAERSRTLIFTCIPFLLNTNVMYIMFSHVPRG